MAQALIFGDNCFNCLRLTGERHRMISGTGYDYCPNCKNTVSRLERRRNGISDNLRMGGFMLLLLTNLIYLLLPIPKVMPIYLMFAAGYSFFALNAFARTKEVLQHG